MSNTTRLYMERDGVKKEIDMTLLSENVVDELEEAYKRSPVVGIGNEVYAKVAFFWKDKWTEFLIKQSDLNENVTMGASKVLARVFDIDSNTLLFEAICWIEVNSEEDDVFSARNVNENEITRYLSSARGKTVKYMDLKEEFESCYCGSKEAIKAVGPIKFLKFFTSILQNDVASKVFAVA